MTYTLTSTIQRHLRPFLYDPSNHHMHICKHISPETYFGIICTLQNAFVITMSLKCPQNSPGCRTLALGFGQGAASFFVCSQLVDGIVISSN